MLRPLLAFATFCLAAFLLAPTVASVHEGVERLGIKREMPWSLWKWTDDPEPPPFASPNCDHEQHQLYSEVTQWPERIHKDEPFTIGGVVKEEDTGRGVDDVKVDLFLNESKDRPGVWLGQTTSTGGRFVLSATVPFELRADRYHLVAHAHERRVSCKIWYEHWSDPEMDVLSATRFVVEDAETPVVGHPHVLRAQLIDAVGAPVGGANVTIEMEGREPLRAVTDSDGRFTLEQTPREAGNVTVRFSYAGTKYYEGTQTTTFLDVKREDVELDGGGSDTGVTLQRSTPEAIGGVVRLADQKRPGEVSVAFGGRPVAACETCPLQAALTATPDETGRFRVEAWFPADAPPGPFDVTVTGGGLEQAHAERATLLVPTRLVIDASGTGFFSKSYEGNVTLLDDADRPLVGVVGVVGPEGWASGQTGADGSFAVAGAPGCGSHDLQAFYNGTGYYMPANAGSTVGVCAILAYLPPWLLAIPWWGWVLLALAPFVLLWAWRRLQERFATTISRGPPLTLAFETPSDAAAGIVGVGEPAVVAASLEEPLPDGHRLRMGTFRAMEERPLDADLRARLALELERLGDFPVRAEILDARGRVVTRRTLTLRVVRYAEEIEARYLALRRERMGDQSHHVTPREFEAWLRARLPDVEPEVAQRLVHLFEEADYGPRDAGREELLAYLAAEGSLAEVSPDAVA